VIRLVQSVKDLIEFYQARMSSDIGFNACRKCLRPADTTDLSSLFDVPGKVEKFEEIADVLVSKSRLFGKLFA
jgi:hypothetical protein